MALSYTYPDGTLMIFAYGLHRAQATVLDTSK
jgi:hypothetical protein